MSWGSAAEGASTAGSGAGGAGAAAGSAGSAATVAPAATPMVSTAGGAGGYAIDATQSAQSSPSFMDSAMNNLESFQKGAKQSLPEAYRSFGNNPQTYGYVANKLQSMAGAGGGAQPANVTTNISYQQPENEYLRKRRGY